MSKKLIRSGLLVSAATLASRVLGLVRDIVIAHLLGAGAAADVFFFANRIPNYLRRLFADGAFNQAFVPVMTEYKAKGDKAAVRELLSATMGTLGAIISVVTVIGVLGSTVLSALFGWGCKEHKPQPCARNSPRSLPPRWRHPSRSSPYRAGPARPPR